MSFVGSIVGTQGEQVEVAFDIDKTAAGGNRYGFAPATGNLMYCMPQKGTKTSLYIGNGDEAQGIATGCIRTNGSTCEGTGSPEKKSFRSEHGKGMDLYPQRMGLDGGETGKITFEDETGTTIESNGGLVLMAKEGIRLESMTGIAMQGMSDIMALYAEGASSLCVNGSVDMLGRLAGISASKYTGYPPYDDAPKEGEFDWDGFTRNLAIGLGVVAVCAIGAAISIATLGAGSILAGAFIGAGIGALSTTAMKAGEEISTGNVRSAKEAFRDVGISAVSGFITGAFGAKFPGAHRLVEGVVDTVVSAGERYLYAVFDDSMSREEKRAYALDPRQMVADFVTGVVIGEFLDGITAAIQNKLRSIFANYDATMREALESGTSSELKVIGTYDNNNYFTRAVEFNAGSEGTGFTYKVYQRNDIDWNMVRTTGAKKGRGLTNAQAAEKYGLAPILNDGYVATLHHSQQRSVGPLFEASTRYRNISNAKKGPLHPYKGQLNPFNPMDSNTRGLFQKVDSIEYWKARGRSTIKYEYYK